MIAAAGYGTRFLPATQAYPKELLPVLGKPVIQLIVEELVGAGIKEILIVYRPGNSLIKRFFYGNGELNGFLKKVNKSHLLDEVNRIKDKIRFLAQPRKFAYGTGSPVLAAKKFIGKDPFVFVYGDDLIMEKKKGQFLAQLIKIFEKYQAAAVFGAQKVPWNEVQRYGSIRFKKESQIPYQVETVEEGLFKDKAPTNLVQFGRFVVSPEVITVLKNQKLSAKNELFFTDAMKALAKTKTVIAYPIENAKWLTIGDPERWLQTNIEFKKFLGKAKI